MSLSIFDSKAIVPNEDTLRNFLGASIHLWNELFSAVNSIGTASGEWKFYSQKAGWSFVVKQGKRTMLYLIPQNEYFKVNFVFGEKAASEAKIANISETVKKSIEDAVPHMEGRSFMFDIRNFTDLELAKILLQIKQKN